MDEVLDHEFSEWFEKQKIDSIDAQFGLSDEDPNVVEITIFGDDVKNIEKIVKKISELADEQGVDLHVYTDLDDDGSDTDTESSIFGEKYKFESDGKSVSQGHKEIKGTCKGNKCAIMQKNIIKPTSTKGQITKKTEDKKIKSDDNVVIPKLHRYGCPATKIPLFDGHTYSCPDPKDTVYTIGGSKGDATKCCKKSTGVGAKSKIVPYTSKPALTAMIENPNNPNQIKNPRTGRWVNKDGDIGKALLSGKYN